MHMIDMTTGVPAMAYVGAEPWHGLGVKLQPDADMETWRKSAGLSWEAKESPVLYQNGELRKWDARKVIYRSDTGAPLAVVGDGYNVVQPAEIFDFFKVLSDLGGFSLETAGALSDGRRVWALAKVNDGACVVDGDLVRPYLLLATSYDGTMATIGKFTAIRVVCHNTITMAVGGMVGGVKMKGEDATDKGYLTSDVRILHREKFNADEVRRRLGIATNVFERFLITSRQLAHVPMKAAEADEFVRTLLDPYYRGEKDISESKGYKRIMELFHGAQRGAEFAPGTRWAMLNSITELVDHERGRSANTRLESAWFGTGNAIKSKALELLAA